jgi:uncharacterized protein YeeX (DUF496 family)
MCRACFNPKYFFVDEFPDYSNLTEEGLSCKEIDSIIDSMKEDYIMQGK